jgi:hypothetical protein
MRIRPAVPADRAAIWAILEPVIRAGETYALPRDMSEDAALAYWCAPANETFVADDGGTLAGTYILRAMQFNFVVSTNERAVRTWQRNGFDIVGRLPGAFNHPTQGYVDALVMYRKL